MGQVARGKVERFDREAGLGELRGADGRLLAFHCTEIAGGTRDIAVGTEVTFELAPGHLGAWEARSVTPLSGPEPKSPGAQSARRAGGHVLDDGLAR